jgi:Protein of unknown function (DUF2778)
LIAATAAVAVGMATTPGTPSTSPDISDALPETKIASIAPSLEWAAPHKSFLTGSAATVPARARFGQNWFEHFENQKEARLSGRSARVAQASKRMSASRAKQIAAAAPDDGRVARAAMAKEVPWPAPASERFGGAVEPTDLASPVILAYADPSPTGVAALEALANGDSGNLLADVPPEGSVEGVPEVPLPLARPNIKPQSAAAPKADKTETANQDTDEAAPDIAPAARPRDKEMKLALARPDNPDRPSEGGSWLGRLFGNSNRANAGDGVAVYDITAAKVYMPDGTTLEAHSGVGHMADDPRYVSVKMNGPTPPHTYVLKMREARFHGVEAIRMLPVNGKGLYGRGGFLTHSYLLRGRRAQSHGCVAFADYPRFLAAFKAGKVKTLVVVASGGKGAIRMAKNGQGA